MRGPKGRTMAWLEVRLGGRALCAIGLAVALPLGCGGGDGDDGIGYQESAACASAGTPLGQQVTNAAAGGPSTVRVGDIDTRENTIASGPIVEGEAQANALT